uniref:Uncharacterized protein n=2 Tax=Avena sativa TaxID=4498 RepID=A0ACD5WHI3_AVESA
MDLILPFKIGDAVELKSFDEGYRGAWFRCKINETCIRYGHLEYKVEYMDYPEEKMSWSRLYKIPPKCRNRKGRQNREIMLRPAFPQLCWGNDIPQHGQKMDVIAVVSTPWKVGDLIDWSHKGCFWTGKIIKLLGDGKVKIVCPEIPLGEGGCYDADTEDLRPALDWSLEKGWSAPLSQENGESWYTARLITENPDTSSSDEDIEQCYDGNKEVQKCLNGSVDTPKQDISKCLNGASVEPEKVMYPDVTHPANTNGMCCMNRQTHSEEEPQKCTKEEPLEVLSQAQLAPSEIDGCCTNSQADYPTSPMAISGHSSQVLANGQSCLTSYKKLKTSTEHASVQSRAPDTVGEALMDVERLASKIRRAEDLLQSIDDDAPSSKAMVPSWRFYR